MKRPSITNQGRVVVLVSLLSSGCASATARPARATAAAKTNLPPNVPAAAGSTGSGSTGSGNTGSGNTGSGNTDTGKPSSGAHLHSPAEPHKAPTVADDGNNARPPTATTTSTSEAPPVASALAPAQPRDDPYWALDRCPSEMTLLPGDVCIDRWEATLVEVLASGRQRAWSPYKSPGRRRLMAISKPGVVPQGYINGRQAAAACKAASKRLCAESEWAQACGGPDQTQYPYGEQHTANACNDDGRGRHPVAEAGGKLGWSMDRMWREGMSHPMLNQLRNTVEKTGHHASCTNSYGAFDMVGNLHEWIRDEDGTFRGGFFMDAKINGDGCDYKTTAHSTKYHDYSIGFRCCKDADDG